MEKKYVISDTLQQFIDWENIMKMPRYAGGHDEQMQGLFKGAKVIGHWNEGDYQGMVATCVQLADGRFVIYNDYYGSCSGCDSWEDATDQEVKSMCINLSNGAFIFQSLEDVKEYLSGIDDDSSCFDWRDCSKPLLQMINSYCFKASLYRMGFKDDFQNKDSLFKVLMMIDGYLVEVRIKENPSIVYFSIFQFDGSLRWIGYEHKAQIIELPNRVSIKYVMQNINITLSTVLNMVSNNIENKITSNCKDAIHKAMSNQ